MVQNGTNSKNGIKVKKTATSTSRIMKAVTVEATGKNSLLILDDCNIHWLVIKLTIPPPTPLEKILWKIIPVKKYIAKSSVEPTNTLEKTVNKIRNIKVGSRAIHARPR